MTIEGRGFSERVGGVIRLKFRMMSFGCFVNCRHIHDGGHARDFRGFSVLCAIPMSHYCAQSNEKYNFASSTVDKKSHNVPAIYQTMTKKKIEFPLDIWFNEAKEKFTKKSFPI